MADGRPDVRLRQSVQSASHQPASQSASHMSHDTAMAAESKAASHARSHITQHSQPSGGLSGCLHLHMWLQPS